MKDVEFFAQLFLFLERGEISTSQADLDDAFSERDKEWERKEKSTEEFSKAIETIKSIIETAEGDGLPATRLRNQADFYSLFAAIAELIREGVTIDTGRAAQNLRDFIALVEDGARRAQSSEAQEYFDATRSASNDAGPRRKRINRIKTTISA